MNIKFNELTPVLAVSSMSDSLGFYVDKLGFQVAWTWPTDENTDQAGVRIDHDYHRDQFQLALIDDNPTSLSSPGWLFVNVSNIDELYLHYKSLGLAFAQEIDNFPWGYREFWINDHDGNQLRFTCELQHSTS